MSFSSLNIPPLIGSLSIGCYTVILPVLSRQFQNSDATSWTVVKVSNLLAYGLSVVSVSQPGRYDSEVDTYEKTTKDDGSETNKKAATSDVSAGREGLETMSPGRRGRTLVAPAGWAFAIWGPIFLGELIMVSSQWLLIRDDQILQQQLIRQVTGPYVSAQIFQSLWSASFRPSYKNGWYKYISAVNLSGIAYALSFCHAAYTVASTTTQNNSTNTGVARQPTMTEYLIYYFPLTLHFGWTTAAALVNWNGMLAMEKEDDNKNIHLFSSSIRLPAKTVMAWVGHGSVIVATAIGVTITVQRSAPVYGGVIAWALAAVSSGMTKRLRTVSEDIKNDKDKRNDNDAVGLYGADTQRKLSLFGAVICLGTAVLKYSNFGL